MVGGNPVEIPISVRRGLAALIDGAIGNWIGYAATSFLGVWTDHELLNSYEFYIGQLAALFLYYSLFPIVAGERFGRRLLGIRVVGTTSDGDAAPTYKQLLKRDALGFLFSAINIIPALFFRDQRHISDRIADTRVITSDPSRGKAAVLIGICTYLILTGSLIWISQDLLYLSNAFLPIYGNGDVDGAIRFVSMLFGTS